MSDSRIQPDRDPEPRAAEESVVKIRCREHGPLVVELPDGSAGHRVVLRVTDHLGRDFPLPTHKRAVALCRCGHTANRPFCDGSHRDCGFFAADTAPGAD